MTLEEKLKSNYGKCEFYTEREAAEYGNVSFNCCKKVLRGANTVYDLGLDKNAERVSAAFGGGMGIQTVCGAVTGALMSLGLKCCDNIEKNSNIKEYSIPFLEKVEKNLGSIYCKDLKEKYFIDKPLIRCDGVIFRVAASAKLFAKEGAKVVVADINEASAKEVVDSIRSEGGDAVSVKVDVTDNAQLDNMIDTCIKTYGRVDILFNNAGMPLAMPVEDVTEETFYKIVNVNLKGVFFASQKVAPYMKEQGGGVILTTASVSIKRPRPKVHLYCAVKSAAVHLGKALAMEFAPYNIRVNSINPVACETPMLKDFYDPTLSKDKAHQAMIDSIPLGHLIQPEDIAYAALYLASDEARMITGVDLNVDGGRAV